MDKKEYYIINLEYSKTEDKLITFWRKDCRGYCWQIDWAGKYPESVVMANKEYYNNGTDTLAVPCDEVEEALKKVLFNNEGAHKVIDKYR